MAGSSQSSIPLMPSGGDQPFLELVAGKDKGKIYAIHADRMTIGRSDGNDIVIVSDAVSRQHAVIVRSDDGRFSIHDNQSKNGVQINGQSVAEGTIQNGDLIQVGTSVFRFTDPIGSQSGNPAASQALPPSPVLGRTVKGRFKINKRAVIYGGLALFLGFFWFLSRTPSPSSPSDAQGVTADGSLSEAKSAANSQVPAGKDGGAVASLEPPKFENPSKESSLAGLKDPAMTPVEQQTDKLDLSDNSLKEAEQYFRKGQREYLDQNYHRAIDNFQAALSLNRNHELAEYYLRLAIFEVEAQAKTNYEIGLKYFESMQYSRAIYHFKEAMSLMSHRPTDKLIGDCEKYIAQAKLRLEAAEQLP